MKMRTKIRIWLVSLFLLLMMLITLGWVEARGTAPSFEKHFASKMLTSSKGSDERLFNIACVKASNTIRQNVECLFFPSIENNGGYLRGSLKYIGYILIFVHIVIAASKLLFSGKNEKALSEFLSSMMMIVVGGALYFGALWIFGSLVNLGSIQTTQGLKENLTGASGLLFFLLSLLKAGAFLYAIVMIVWTGFKMMNPSSAEEWGGKKLAGNLTGIIAALVGMKVVDFLYYIASMENFATQAGNFIVQIAKFMAYGSGVVVVLMIIYTGYQLAIDGGSGENYKKARQVLTNIVLAVISLFFFLFLLYQIFAEFN